MVKDRKIHHCLSLFVLLCLLSCTRSKTMPLGELFLSGFLGGFFNVLIDRLSSRQLLDFLRQEGFDKNIEEWKRTLRTINSLLRSAEENQQTDPAKEWLADLEDLAYDVEDMLDELEYEAIAKKVKMDPMQSNNFLKHVPACVYNWTPDAVSFRSRVRSQVNHVSMQFDKLCELRDKLGLQVTAGHASSLSSASHRQPTSGHQTETTVYGRDADKKIILDMVRNEPAEHNLFTISIVGMGGLGKTTLAQEVFMALKNEFDVSVWVCVSDGEFDVTKISKSILGNITGDGSSSLPDELPTLHDKIVENVKGKKLLIVFDDVWSDDYRRWKTVLSPLRASAAGSRIIITARSKVVASTLKSDQIHILDLLQLEECWSIVLMNVKNKTIIVHPDKKLIKEKVFARTKGLPLAAATLGGILHLEHIDTWLKILDHKLWDLSNQRDKQIPAALKLSYYHLPNYLKRCFGFCSLFPKDYPFQREELVYLWIAAGLIQPSTEEGELEELGCSYFSDLLGRCLLQRSSGNEVEEFSMHDLVHDLAIWAFGERDLPLDGISKADMRSGESKKARHFAYVPSRYDDEKKFQLFQNVEGLKGRTRAFLPIPEHPIYERNNIADSVIFELLWKLKRLRVLSLQGYSVTRVPALLGCLKHLTYINFSYTWIESLPESVSMLYNLQFLMLRHCSKLRKLPSNFKYLLKLRHLDLESCILIKEMPFGMKELKNLCNLSHFIVGEDGRCSNIKDLKDLINLCGKLRISRLSNVVTSGDNDRILKDKENLEELSLEWESTGKELLEKRIDVMVLDMLQPHEQLRKLAIHGYHGTKFSSWVGAAAYSHLKVLELNDCEKCESLPSLGVLNSLEELTIKRMKSLKGIGTEFYGESQTNSFKSLKLLCFEHLPVWVEWALVEGNEYGNPFPCLLRLSMVDCPKLSRSFPQCLLTLEDLTVRNCEQLVVSFSCILPKLSKIVIHGCKTIKCHHPEMFKSLKYLQLSDIAEYSNGLMHGCFGKPAVEQVKDKVVMSRSDEISPQLPWVRELHSLKFLGELFLSAIANIVSIPEVCSLPHLKILRIENCNALISLPEQMKTENECIESVYISVCNSLQFILSGHLPLSLKKLEITKCMKLEKLWDDRGGDSCNTSYTNLSQLEVLIVEECHSLICLSSIVHFPSSLKELRFKFCGGLTKLNQSGELPASLMILNFVLCSGLTTIGKRFLNSNTSIKVIEIWYSDGLLQIPSGIDNLRHLRELTVACCQSMEYFPMEGLAANTNLRKLYIRSCPALKALPNGLRRLDSLEEVGIEWCPSIPSFNPEEVFPTHIKSLSIADSENVYRSLVGWGLQNLTSLTSLYLINIPDMESFPQAELEVKLPSSLTSLHIFYCEKLKKLQGLREVTSLQSMTLADCSDLASFGDEGLPSSLHTLKIDRCPKLKRECARNGGTETDKLSNIPWIYINHQPIFTIKDEEARSSSQYRYPCLTNPMNCCMKNKD